MQAVTIKLFLATGRPDGLRTAEISNWSGKAVCAPRTQLAEFLNRSDTTGPGIYFLSGRSPKSDLPALYIGEGERVGKRVKQQLKQDFWVGAVCFVSKDDNLTKAHIKYLEGKFIDLARQLSGIELMNTNPGGATLPEADAAEMEAFLSNVLQLLPNLGIDHFAKRSDRPRGQRLYCRIKGLEATGMRTSRGFIVFKGSQTVFKLRPSATYLDTKRQKLVENGIMQEGRDCLVFTRDYEFSSPSAAASMIRGGASNGLRCWKSAKGKTLKELEAADV